MTEFSMRHYFHCDHLGNIHVNTHIDAQRWQHHVHSSENFARWRNLMAGTLMIRLPDDECDCDLAVGQVLEHDGRIWNHPLFV